MNNLFLKISKFSLNKQKEGNSEGKVVEKARKNETASGGTSRNIPAQSESAKSLSNPVSSSSQNDINNDEDKQEKTRELEEHVGRLQDQIGRLSTLLEEAMEEKTAEMDDKFRYRSEAGQLREKVEELERLLREEEEARKNAEAKCARLQDEVFLLRGKATSAAAARRKGRTISLPGTPAEKHGLVSQINGESEKLKKNRNVSSAISKGAVFAKRLWMGTAADTRLRSVRSASEGNYRESISPLSVTLMSLPGENMNDTMVEKKKRRDSDPSFDSKNKRTGSLVNDMNKPDGRRVKKRSITVASSSPRNKKDFLDIVPLLSSISIFRHMNIHEKEVIARTMVREEFKAGDFIVRQGEVGNSFYIILEGTLDVITHDVHPGKPFKPEKMSDSSSRRVARLESKQWFGETGLVRSLPRTASVCASTPSTCLKLDREIFDDLRKNFDATVLENMKVYSNYRESNDFVEELRQWLHSATNKKQYVTVLEKYPSLTLNLNSSRKRRTSVAGGPEQLDRDLKREAGVILNEELFSFHGTPEPTEMVFGRFHALLNTLVLKMLHKHGCFSEQNVNAVIEDIMLASNRTIAGGDSYAQANLLLGNSELVVLSPQSAEADPSIIDISVETCTVSITVTQKYKVSHFDDDMAVEVWATIQSQLSEQIMFDLKKINAKKSARSDDKSGSKVGNIIESSE